MSEFSEKAKTIGVISKRTKPRVHEGREHPETGRPFKATTDELGATITEHGMDPASGVSERQDVSVRPKPVHLQIGVNG